MKDTFLLEGGGGKAVKLKEKRAGPEEQPRGPSASASSSGVVTPSGSMEFEEARKRLLEVEQRQRLILELEGRVQELHHAFVRSELEAVEHGEVVSRINSGILQGEVYISEKGQHLKKTVKFKKHKPTVLITSMLGLSSCIPWSVKLK
ncbi:TMF-regulated nuclear protein 1 [Latimeria chalumnae]|uniref:TMF-regulated nuclear protein 1 n=1 Tax=Latimeria chalumnae TaxID=7897 RepID=UPI0006D93118|nr:PREDICTED: TMF-regulated nuclear protein 1 [Latimeria chalumnae]|eukprot:XP_014341065.1 PREDICTED: TMF-regulated nuclear protein 1 [Latimeria chalumnae]